MKIKKVPIGLYGGGTSITSNVKEEKVKKENLFETPFWTIKSKIPSDAYEWALDYKKRNIEKARFSNLGGYQSIAQTGFDDFPYANFLIEKLSFLPKFMVANWWLNINDENDSNVAHTHPGSDLACVWYITDNNEIGFVNEKQHSRWNLNDSFNRNYPGLVDVTKLTNKGDLIVFPADVYHLVRTTSEVKEDNPNLEIDNKFRISVSFNLFMLNES